MHVILYRGEGNGEPFGDLLVAQPEGDESSNFPLSRGEPLERRVPRPEHDERMAQLLGGVEVDGDPRLGANAGELDDLFPGKAWLFADEPHEPAQRGEELRFQHIREAIRRDEGSVNER